MNIKKFSEQSVLEAVDIIKQGGVVICPTDTNYVVMTNVQSSEGVNRIYSMKKRDGKKPLTLLLGKIEEINEYAFSTKQVDSLVKSFWPGPLTVILRKKEIVPDFVTCSFETVALTLFKNEVLSEITKKLDAPVAATSANLSGTGIVPGVDKAIDHLGEFVDLIIDNGVSSINGSNTIIDFTFLKPIVARKGAISEEEVIKFIPELNCNVEEYSRMLQERINLS